MHPSLFVRPAYDSGWGTAQIPRRPWAPMKAGSSSPASPSPSTSWACSREVMSIGSATANDVNVGRGAWVVTVGGR